VLGQQEVELLARLLEEDPYDGLAGLLVVLGHRVLPGALSWPDQPACRPAK